MKLFFGVWIIFVSTVVLHGLLGRIGRPRNSILRYLSVWGVGNLALMVSFWGQEVSRIEWFAGFALFAFLGEIYVFLFTFVMSSVSAAILMKSSSLQNEFPDEEPRKMVEKRIATLVRVGLLQISTKGQELTSRGRCVLKIYQTLRILFGHGKVRNSC